MAEFIEVARAKRRMCKAHTGKCSECKLQWNCSLLNVFAYNDNEVKKLENEVISWAAENPEPQYPTWGEWFAERGDLIKSWQHIKVCSDHGQGVIGFLYDTIPSDIAQKLGIEPKEG